MKGEMFRDRNGRSYLVPFILVASLFFLWGVAHSILDVLNKHFQDVLVISKARSGLVQAMVYGGYFLMALPAGKIIRKWGYRAGIVTGLLLYGIGALMFIPGGRMMSFPFFLLCLFVIGCGLTCLETSANPYITVLGDRHGAARRLNLAQSLNGLGWIIGPLLGGLLILGDDSDIAMPYAVIGMVVVVLGLVFSRLRLPSPDTDAPDTAEAAAPGGRTHGSVWKVRTFRYGVPALLLYVAAQTGINSFFINYVMESSPEITARTAALMLSFGGMGLFMLGRLLGTALMRKTPPRKLMVACSAGAPDHCLCGDGRHRGPVPDVPLRERHVPHHILHGTYRHTRRGHQDRLVLSGHVHRRWRRLAGPHGTDRGDFHGPRIHSPASLLHRCGSIRRCLQETETERINVILDLILFK